MSADIDKCETEGLGADGEDGCQREDRSAIDPQLCTSLAPLLFICLFYPPLFYFLLFAFSFFTVYSRTETNGPEQDGAG